MRLLVRHRWRLIKTHGMILRYAIGLVDRIFPEYEDVFSRPFLPSVRTLIREIGLTPDILVAKKIEVRKTLERASKKRLAPGVINELLSRAATSIGTRQGMDVVNDQLRTGSVCCLGANYGAAWKTATPCFSILCQRFAL